MTCTAGTARARAQGQVMISTALAVSSDWPSDAPTPHWFYLPALLLIALVWWNQGRRLKPRLKPAVA